MMMGPPSAIIVAAGWTTVRAPREGGIVNKLHNVHVDTAGLFILTNSHITNQLSLTAHNSTACYV